MKHFTRAVDPKTLRGLLEQPPRANLAFNDAGTLTATPVAFRFQDGCYRVGVRAGPSEPTLQPEQEVALVIDEGCHYFDLRAVCIRGRSRPAAGPPDGGSSELSWFQIVPEKVIAWDFATMREAAADASR